jgi:hypothetical protein
VKHKKRKHEPRQERSYQLVYCVISVSAWSASYFVPYTLKWYTKVDPASA